MIPFAKLLDSAYAPTISHDHDAGMDFYCQRYTSINPYKQALISTGITVEIPRGFVGLLKPKGAHHRLIGSGVIEWTYQGEIIFRVFNATDEEIVITRGKPIGQMIIVENLEPIPIEVDRGIIHIRPTDRGATGGIVLSSV